ncbi:MAG: GxxExxY protein [Candidatus Omnitrophota bacterium]|nr:GxxExxY protein [Candidatus Omnitrophota bacterium]
MNDNLKRKDLVYPDLCYQIIGILFDVYNNLGYGRSEKVYQRAVALGLKDSGLEFKEQFYMPLIYKNKQIGSNRFDFLIADKMILEIKKGDRFVKSHIDQVYSYLVGSNLKLGILAYFAPRNIHFKRIVNL